MVWWKGWMPGEVLAWSVFVAGLLQMGALWITCLRLRSPVKVIRPRFNGEMKRLFSLMGPGVVSAGIQQVNLLVGGIIASFQAGAVSYLYYSDRVYQLPLGMIGIALGVVLLPEVTRQLRSGHEREASDSILSGMELGLLLTIPAAVAMIVIPEPLIRTLFQRGEFDAESSLQTARALMGFAIGLPGYVLIKVLQPGYFAREDTKSPMKIAGVSVVTNIIVSLALFPFLGHVGIAIGTSVAAWVNVWMLWRGLGGFVRIRQRHRRKIVATIVASVLMGLALWLMMMVVGPWFAGGLWMKVGGLSLLVSGGLTVYGLAALLFKATSLAELKNGLRGG
jgi:putative peptidoglycan lipid II flippase